jgi:hypothetical protein
MRTNRLDELTQKRVDNPRATAEQFDRFIAELTAGATMREAAEVADLDPEEVPLWSPRSELGRVVDQTIAWRNQQVEEWRIARDSLETKDSRGGQSRGEP